MDNKETEATMRTQDTGKRQTPHRHQAKGGPTQTPPHNPSISGKWSFCKYIIII
jgi:hypothetical protein